MSNQKNTMIVLVLIVTVIIDVMGMGLVFPLMPALFVTPSSIFVAASASSAWHYFWYGIAMGAWPLGIFFGTPYLGDLSDQYGRKRILMTCLFGTALTYILSAISIQYAWMGLFCISRVLSGFFSGSFVIAQAVMVDISPKHLRPKYLGWITLAGSIGIVIGPIITSLSAESSTVHWMTLQTPFYIAGVLSLLNLMSVFFMMKEPTQARRTSSVTILNAVIACHHIFTDPRTRLLAIAFLVMQVGWGFYTQDIPVILSHEFHLRVRELGYFFTVLGLGIFVGIIFFQPLMLRLGSLKMLTISMIWVSALILSCAVIFPILKVQWAVVFLVALPELVAYTASLTLLSHAVSDAEQGKIMGGTGAIYGLSWVLNAILVGTLSDIWLYLPLVLGCLGFALAGVITCFYKVPVRSPALSSEAL